MLTLSNSSFWLSFLLFFVGVLVAFFIPGHLTLRKLDISFFQKFVLGTIIGMVLWGWQGFVFGYLGIRWFSYIYLAVTFLLWVKLYVKKDNFSFLKTVFFSKIDWLTSLLLLLGLSIQLSTVWFNGLLREQGLYFCCGNPSDNILYVALTNQLVKHFPPYEPGMFGMYVQNYHYWSNLVLGELIRVFNLPLINTQYQYSTFFISLFLGLSAIVFGQIIALGKNFIRWLIFFLYFSGDLVFLVVSIIRREINFQMSSLEDGAKFLVNPPRAFAIVILFAGISLFVIWLKKKDKYTGLLVSLIFAVLIGFKAYIGFFVLSGLAVLSTVMFFKKQFSYILLFIMTAVLSSIIYFPVNSSAGGLYFTGFAVFENFIVQPWMMLGHLEQARVIYVQHQNWLRVIQQEVIFIILFIVSIFGIKNIGLIQSKKSLSRIPLSLNIFLISGIIVSAILGFFFQQQSGEANTFNFLVSVFIISSIYAALACDYWLDKFKKNYKIIAILAIITLTIPRVGHEFLSNTDKIINNKGFVIGKDELDALRFLKEKTNSKSIILVDYQRFKVDAESPYVSFLADRPMFLSGIGNELSSHGIDFSKRKALADDILNDHIRLKAAKILTGNKIDYLYLSTVYSIISPESYNFMQNVFTNKEVTILKVSHEAIRRYLKENAQKEE